MRSIGERIWEQIKRVLLRERVEKELAARMQRQEAEHIITDPTKQRRSMFDLLFLWRGRRTQRRGRREVVGTVPTY